MKRFVKELDPYLTEEGFSVDFRHPISDWHSLANKLYAPQLQDSVFASEFNAYLWITKSLFGNNALAYQISREEEVERNLSDLKELKDRFRRDISEKIDDPITFLINLDRLKTYQPVETGKRGIIHIGQIPLEEGSYDGRWDYFFFKYIHTPDNKDCHEREEGILRSLGIYNRRITEDQWAQMKETGTLTPAKNSEVYNG
ncbi:MAG: hypothetical protein KKB31_02035 [Nanoarchaeota archaeon]|nr:hypothetical protein [Nanoarchaeota archaeon]